MDLSIRKYIYAFLAFVCVMLSAVSCIYDEYEDDPTSSGSLQFRIISSVDTKVSYPSEYKTIFTAGDEIGCVVASKTEENYTYVENVKWTYKRLDGSSSGVLMLSSSSKIKPVSDQAKAEQGYVELTDAEMNYAFFFYYPYSPSVNSLDHVVSASTDQSAGISDFIWTNYVLDQRTKTENITSANANYPVNLTFEKKMAVIDIHCDGDANNKVTSPQIQIGTSGTSIGSNTIYTKSGFNLSTGSYDFTSNTAVFPNNQTGSLTPYLWSGTEESTEKIYRMHVIPQTFNDWSLVVSLNGTTHNPITLEDKLTHLEEGKLYILHIAPAGNGSVEIVDWNSGAFGDLVPEDDVEVVGPVVGRIDNAHRTNANLSAKSIIARPGEQITLTGQNLNLIGKLIVHGVEVSVEATDDGKNITFTFPAFTDVDNWIEGDIVMVTGTEYADVPVGTKSIAGTYILPAPKVTEVIREGTDITLKGTDLDLATSGFDGSVRRGETVVDVELVDGDLKLTLPLGEYNDKITLETSYGKSSVVEYDYLPVFDSFDKQSVSVGSQLTINGTNLDLVHSITFVDNITVTEFESKSQDTIILMVPEGAQTGSLKLNLDNDSYVETSELTIGEVVVDPPTITGSRREGEDVIFTGTGLDLVDDVYVNDVSVSFTVVSSTEIKVAGTDAGFTGPIKVESENGVSDSYEYNFTPVITRVTDEYGNTITSMDPGKTIRVYGNNLDLANLLKFNSSDQYVRINNLGNPSIEYVTVTVPAGASGSTSIQLRDVSGNDQGAYEGITVKALDGTETEVWNGSNVVYSDWNSVNVGDCMIVYVNPSDNSDDWSFQLNGATYTNSTSVMIQLDQSSLDYFRNNGGFKIGDISPSNCQVSKVTVLKKQVAGGGDAPRVDSITPTTGEINGELKILGTNLDKVVSITFAGGVTVDASAFITKSVQELKLRIPEGAQTGTLKLNLANGTYVETSTLTITGGGEQIVPTINPPITRYDQLIYVDGTNLKSVTSVYLNDENNPLSEGVYSVNDDGTRITIDLTKGGQKGVTGFVMVGYDGGTKKENYNFTPTVTSFDKTEVAVGETITITGTNLDLVDKITFVNGGSSCGVTVQVPGETLTFTVPEGAQTGQITLSCIDGGTTTVTPGQTITITSSGGGNQGGSGDVTETELWAGSVNASWGNVVVTVKDNCDWTSMDLSSTEIYIRVHFEYYEIDHNNDNPYIRLLDSWNTKIEDYTVSVDDTYYDIAISSSIYSKLTANGQKIGFMLGGHKIKVKKVSLIKKKL
ncbi:MAG: IPT/TIG domain-containing protein [Bacteroidales bacterium]|nr:IPT/TIG domain-containing protein [Bacteroidales bacterium]